MSEFRLNQELSVKIKAEEYFMMRESDWQRMRTSLVALGRGARDLTAAAWAVVGILVSAVFTGITWLSTAPTLSPAAVEATQWVWPTIVNIAIGSAVVSAFAFYAAGRLKGQQRRSINVIIEDMDNIHELREMVDAAR